MPPSATVFVVHYKDIRLIDGAVTGAWIGPRLGGQFGAVTLEVPKGFEAYARIFHPASDPFGKPVKWAEVAKACGTTPHPEMQWHALLGLGDASELRGSYSPGDGSGVTWAGSDPPTGPMPIDTLDSLCHVLANYTAEGAQSFFGLCTIHGWLEFFSPKDLPPLLELPSDRNYLVLTGPLSAVDQIMYDWSGSLQMTLIGTQGDGTPPQDTPSAFLQREAPNLIWPADHSWLVASEVDFDSTLVGGDRTLVDAIVDSERLEAWHVEPADSLGDSADTVNVASTR